MAEQKNAQEHQKWMYNADPFTARKMVDERQAKAAQRREETSRPEGRGSDAINRSLGLGVFSSEFSNAPEVKMASGLREVVEESIKKVRTGNLGLNYGILTISSKVRRCLSGIRVDKSICY